MAFRRHAFGHDRFAGASIIGTIGAFVGMIAAVWMNSLRKRLPVEWRRHRSSFPGSKDGNWIFGTIFGCYRHMEIQWADVSRPISTGAKIDRTNFHRGTSRRSNYTANS